MDGPTSGISKVLEALRPVIHAAVSEFPRGIAQGETKIENSAVLFLQSESTLMRTMLVYLAESDTYCRRDVLDLNLPEVVFELANQSREESIETHDFVYRSAGEAVAAYRHWIAWAVDLLRKESHVDGQRA